ncbi:hypothetical protein Slin15195_G120410 [Septoria linicola]|uniref:Uncharacterized protein n=1 Tax=Septoria linicola TaxID=215465 RepID=A0A9Q9B7I1_9PEZI|nr:hypothetical protein Slin15195_G120410 [Septoria linicola]
MDYFDWSDSRWSEGQPGPVEMGNDHNDGTLVAEDSGSAPMCYRSSNLISSLTLCSSYRPVSRMQHPIFRAHCVMSLSTILSGLLERVIVMLNLNSRWPRSRHKYLMVFEATIPIQWIRRP